MKTKIMWQIPFLLILGAAGCLGEPERGEGASSIEVTDVLGTYSILGTLSWKFPDEPSLNDSSALEGPMSITRGTNADLLIAGHLGCPIEANLKEKGRFEVVPASCVGGSAKLLRKMVVEGTGSVFEDEIEWHLEGDLVYTHDDGRQWPGTYVYVVTGYKGLEE